MNFKDQLLNLNNQWCATSLDMNQFARLHGMSYDEMDAIIGLVQSWDSGNEDRGLEVSEDCADRRL